MRARSLLNLTVIIAVSAMMTFLHKRDIKPPPTAILNGEKVIYTLPYAEKIYGFGGNVPLAIALNDEQRIVKVTPFEHSEDAPYMEMITTAKLLSAWDNLTLAEAATKSVDTVTGATFSSKAIIESVQATARALSAADDVRLPPNAVANNPAPARERLITFALNHRGEIIGAGLLLLSIGLALRRKVNPTYRRILLVANIILLGVIGGNFISLSAILSRIAAPTLWGANFLLGLMLLAAIIMPLITRRPFYCFWVCPLGALQEILGLIHKKKIAIPPAALTVLNHSRSVITVSVLGMWATGIGLNLVDYELFSAMIWGVADYPLLTAGAVLAIISLFINRPYCRFICPTGALIAFTERLK